MSITDVESAALPMTGLTAWQGIFEHGALKEGERVRVLGANGGRRPSPPFSSSRVGWPPTTRRRTSCSTRSAAMSLRMPSGRAAGVVSIAEEADGATYFVVEPNRAQLVELGRRADAGELKTAIDSVFPLEEAAAAFARVAERGKQGKVVLRVADD
jgi:NADPH:quinone reductase-like Zn-dependent oxidoreductase